jgi:crotonobetainyl-CoA:carnitine CoA-transferase CaiB-like acyl-CoA transferase
VIKIEPPEGDPARRWGPFKGDVPNPEASAPFLWLNTNKQSVVLDLRTPSGIAQARRLAAAADVVVEDLAPGALAAAGLDTETLRRQCSALVVCSITPFGQTGPYAGYAGTDIVLQAMGGAMHATGHASREPLRLGGSYAEWQAGLAAAYAVTLAVYRAEQTGVGEHIDLSIYETQAAGKDRRQLALVAHAYSGLIMRRQETAFAICSGIRPCKDGYINLLGNGPRLPALLRMIGRDDLLARPEVRGPEEHIPAELAEEIESAYLAWTVERPMREALAVAQQHHILGGTVHTIADVLADPVFRSRGAFETIEHPATGPVEYPGRPFLMSDSPRPAAHRAPLLGEHTVPVLDAASQAPMAGGAVSHAAPGTRHPALPLAGVRVIDMTVVWAGPYATQQLAEWGAEVIRMEPISAVQPMTRHVERARFLTRELVAAAVARGSYSHGYVDREPGPDPWNRGPLFNASSSNKLSFTGNSTVPAGREAFERLLRIADVVLENNVPSTAEKLGIDYDRLRAIRPDIIVVRMPGFGLSGAYRDYRCWGNHLEAMAGHQLVRSYPDMSPDAAGETYACDSVAGLSGALATVMALRHRARTGRGQLVEVPQVEAFMQMMATEILDYTLNGRVAGPAGNEHRTDAPHGVYPCRPHPNSWIAIHATGDTQWASLCRVLGTAVLAHDQRFLTMASRWRNRRELDAELACLTGERDRDELFQRLQAAGVPAGPVQDEADCFRCPQLAARGFFQEQTRADIGTHRYPGMLFQWTDTPNRHRRPPPTLGQDNDHVYRSLLGYTGEAYQALVDAGEVGTSYPDHLVFPHVE